MKPASRVFAEGVAVSLAGAVAMGLLSFFTRRLLALRLESAAYGFFYSAYTLSLILVTIVGGGLGYAATVLVAKYRARDEASAARAVFGAAVGGATLAGLAVTVLLAAAAPWLLRHYFRYPQGAPTLALVGLAVAPAAVFSCAVAALGAVRDFPARMVAYTAQYALLLLVARAGISRLGLTAAGWGVLASNLLPLAAVLVYLHRRHRLVSVRDARRGHALSETVRFAGWTTFMATALLLLSSTDTLMLTGLRSLHEVAVYNVALPLVQVFAILNVVPLVFAPIAADLWHRGRAGEIGCIASLVFDGIAAFGWVVLIVLLPCSRWVVGLFFGEGFAEAGAPLIILGAGVPIQVAGQFLLNTLAAVGREARSAAVAAASVAVNVACSVFLTAAFGVRGAAAATVLGYAAMAVIGYLALRRHLALPLGQLFRWRTSAAGLLCAGAAWAAGQTAAGALHPLAVACAGVAVYMLACRRHLDALARAARGVLAGGKHVSTTDEGTT